MYLPTKALTLEGFRDWAKSSEFPQRGRISFLDKEILIDMSPEEIDTHGQIKAEVGFTVMLINKKRKRGRYFPDRTLVTNVKANLSTEPDGAFALWKTLDAGLVTLVPRKDSDGDYMELQGTPDWMLEVVSKYSVRKDTQLLREQYHRAGIPEYWLIDARGKEIHFEILIHKPDGYVSKPGRNGWHWSPVFGRFFRLIRRRDRRNLWEYTLQTKSRR